ncbi:MAG TPA: O-antigen ligase family protein [Candidatus Limnocylindrales bacterium]|nr:O-antigen ligase family protein [Candidatus Limnocylindrales bacterium]
MTEQQADARRPAAATLPGASVWLMAAYVVALLVFPADFGLRVGGIVLTPSRLVLVAAALVALIDWRSYLTAARRLPALVWIGWAAFLGSALVTATINPSAASWARYASLVAEGLLVFLLVYRAATATGGLRMLVITVAATTVAVAAVVFALAAFGIHYDHVLSSLVGTEPLREPMARFGLERQAGPFRATLFFGIWMVVASALLMPFISDGRGRARSLSVAAWLMLAVSVAILTVSRIAMTAMFVVPGVYFLVRGRRTIGVACLVIAGIVAVTFSVLSLEPQLAGAGQGETGRILQDSVGMRLASVGATIDALSIKPLFGWGLLSGPAVLSGLIGETSYVDNMYLSLLVELGLVGTVSFLFLVAVILARTSRAWRSAVGLALLIAVVAELTLAIFASTLESTQGYAAFFVLCGLALAAVERPSDALDVEVLGVQSPLPAPDGIAHVPDQRREREAKAPV